MPPQIEFRFRQSIQQRVIQRMIRSHLPKRMYNSDSEEEEEGFGSATTSHYQTITKEPYENLDKKVDKERYFNTVQYDGTHATIQAILKVDPLLVAIISPEFENFFKIVGLPAIAKLEQPGDEVTVYLSLNRKSAGVTVKVYSKYILNFETSMSLNSAMKIDHVELHTIEKREGSPEKITAGIVKKMVKGVREYGLTSIELDAIRSETGFGYNVWPKMGFNGEVNQEMLRDMVSDKSPEYAKAVSYLATLASMVRPIQFSDLFTIEDPTTYEQMKKLWQKHGGTHTRLSFDVQSASSSFKTLARYEKK